jgi:hypothetical protein
LESITQGECIQSTTGESKEHYDKCENSVFIDNKKFKSFQMFRGVRQGNVLSPMLLNMLMNDIRRRVAEG